MKRQNDRILKDELPRSVGAQYATGDATGEITPERMKRQSQSKKKQQQQKKKHPVVDVTGGRRKV